MPKKRQLHPFWVVLLRNKWVVFPSSNWVVMLRCIHPEGKNAKALAQTVITMLLPYIGKIRSITTDNGSEFADHLWIAKRLRTKVFFAHPYSSWEKGCIEYHNKLIRQYIPKGTDFNDISDIMLKEIIIKINRRPRLKLDFSTPVAEFFKFIA